MPPPLRSCLTYRSEAAPVSAGERARQLLDAGHSLRQIAAVLM